MSSALYPVIQIQNQSSNILFTINPVSKNEPVISLYKPENTMSANPLRILFI